MEAQHELAISPSNLLEQQSSTLEYGHKRDKLLTFQSVDDILPVSTKAHYGNVFTKTNHILKRFVINFHFVPPLAYGKEKALFTIYV